MILMKKVLDVFENKPWKVLFFDTTVDIGISSIPMILSPKGETQMPD